MQNVDMPGRTILSCEQQLALAYVPAGKRDALARIWMLDARMRHIFSATREPAITQIKLAWWQERLAELATGQAPAEPLLRLLAPVALDDKAGRQLAALARAWRGLDDEWSDAAIDSYATDRGGALLVLSGHVLGAPPSAPLLLAAEAMAIADLFLLAPSSVRDAVASHARNRFAAAGARVWPRALRPLGMLVALARRDISSRTEPQRGSPARVARMAWHAMTGR